MEQTELQQSIFNAPPPGGAATSLPAASKPAPAEAADQQMRDVTPGDNRGQKRTRDEEDESDEDVAMEEDSDDE